MAPGDDILSELLDTEASTHTPGEAQAPQMPEPPIGDGDTEHAGS